MDEPVKSYYSNGKILLAGEYLVLRGAKSLALPVKFGQKLEVFNNPSENQISWKAFEPGGLWFSCLLKLPDLEILQTNDKAKSLQLVEIFNHIRSLKADFSFDRPLAFTSRLSFRPEWGLGTSSTLIANLAKWTGTDPFQLNKLSFKGSGFDIACASAEGPVIYKQGEAPVEVMLNYPFQDQLFFVYSGRKKATQNEVRRFLSNSTIPENNMEQMNLLTERFIGAQDLNEFQEIIREHEQMVSEAVHMKPLKERFFEDFKGAVKSLGAWGGDFFLVASGQDESIVKQYFRERGYQIIFRWDELVLNRNK